MKTLKILTLLIIGLAILSSCKKDEDDDKKNPPVILSWEFGYENSGIAYAGSDLHMEAEIEAENKVSTIHVTIHPEGEHKNLMHEEWEVDTTYTKFSGIINPTFHEHLDVPAEADEGHYHFHFIITDMEGYVTEKEAELEVQYPTDSEAPTITVSSAPQTDEEFANGATISISGTVTDNIALGGIYIGLVRTNQNLEDADVNAMNTITLLHTHEFDNHMEYNFDASIVVGATSDNNPEPTDLTGDLDGSAAWQSGNYYLVVKSPDAFGGGVAFSQHYPIVLNLE
jgi:hypothetical protein